MQAQHSGSPINDSSGAPCKSDEDTLRRWAEHYEGALNHPPSQPCQELDDAARTTLPDADIPDNAPSLDEVQHAIRRLKNGRAAGADDIPPELLKCAIDPVSRALHGLFGTAWKSGKVPAEWKEDIVGKTSQIDRKSFVCRWTKLRVHNVRWGEKTTNFVQFLAFKIVRSRSECSSYRPITLLSVPGKVFAHVLLARLDPLLQKHRRPHQSGFTRGHSTVHTGCNFGTAPIDGNS